MLLYFNLIKLEIIILFSKLDMGNSNSQQENLKDKNYDGADYTVDPQLRDGPMTDRRCTDCFFALLFIAFLGCYGYTCQYAFTNG